MSAMEEKLQLHRVKILKAGKPWKKKRTHLKSKDKVCKTLTYKLKNKSINLIKYT